MEKMGNERGRGNGSRRPSERLLPSNKREKTFYDDDRYLAIQREGGIHETMYVTTNYEAFE